MLLQSFYSGLLVLAHEAAAALNVGTQDGGEFALSILGGHETPSLQTRFAQSADVAILVSLLFVGKVLFMPV